MSVFKGNGKGTFQAPVNIALAPQTFPFAIGDFNADGRLDIIDETKSGHNYSFEVRLGNGDGTFQAPVSTPTLFQTGLGGIGVGDFNGDGKLDVAAISFTSTRNASQSRVAGYVGVELVKQISLAPPCGNQTESD